MGLKFFYDMPFVGDIILYLLIPLLIVVIICGIVLIVYSYKYKKSERKIFEYRMNVFCLFMAIILCLVFFAILLGFSFAFKIQMDKTELHTTLAYFALLSPIIPAIVEAVLITKIIKVIGNKPENKQIKKKKSK